MRSTQEDLVDRYQCCGAQVLAGCNRYPPMDATRHPQLSTVDGERLCVTLHVRDLAHASTSSYDGFARQRHSG
jgi:hypothetical protein